MPWSRQQFLQHLAAARLLDHIREITWGYLRTHPRASEREAQLFVLKQLQRHRLINELERPIVAFRQSTSEVHYYPPARGSRKLRRGSWILLDLWGRCKEASAPYADITWMAWHGGRVPSAQVKIFTVVRAARDAALRYVQLQVRQGRLPAGQEVHAVARRVIDGAGFRGKFPHSLGHSLGFTGPHGNSGSLSPKNVNPLVPGMGYTIEPGVYLPGFCGARCEMDFFLSRQRDVIITTELQQELVRI